MSKFSLLAHDTPIQVGAHTFVLRSLREADLSAITALEQRAHGHPWRDSHFISSLVGHQCIGLWHGEQLVAYGILSFVVGEAELLLLVLDLPWRGKGVAKAFLSQLLQLSAARARTVFLEVRASNDTAIQLYETLGFNQVGIRPGYYPAKKGREDALLYALELDVDGN